MPEVQQPSNTLSEGLTVPSRIPNDDYVVTNYAVTKEVS